MGPWSHEAEVETFTGDIDLSPAVTVIQEHELAFYDRYLKEIDNGWDERPPAELYVLGAGRVARGERMAPARHRVDAVPPATRRRALALASRAPTSRATATPTTPPTPSRRSAASTPC